MSVYTHPMFPCLKNKSWPYAESTHLVADDVEELHLFASMLGLKRSWFQISVSSCPHYDLTNNMRLKAIKQGAIELPLREFIEKQKQIIKALKGGE